MAGPAPAMLHFGGLNRIRVEGQDSFT